MQVSTCLRAGVALLATAAAGLGDTHYVRRNNPFPVSRSRNGVPITCF